MSPMGSMLGMGTILLIPVLYAALKIVAGVLVLLLLMVLFTLLPPDHLLFVDLSGADTWSQLPC